MELILTVLSKQKALIQVINPDRIWVLYHTSVSTHFIENCEKVLRSLFTRFIFILVIVLARCSLGDDHCSTYVRSALFCLCSWACALTAANCHYTFWHQISHVPVTLLWRECFYGVIWSWNGYAPLYYLLLVTIGNNLVFLTPNRPQSTRLVPVFQ